MLMPMFGDMTAAIFRETFVPGSGSWSSYFSPALATSPIALTADLKPRVGIGSEGPIADIDGGGAVKQPK